MAKPVKATDIFGEKLSKLMEEGSKGCKEIIMAAKKAEKAIEDLKKVIAKYNLYDKE